jgi:hypothetical protein
VVLITVGVSDDLRFLILPIPDFGFTRSFAKPKSRIFTRPSLVTKIFSGLLTIHDTGVHDGAPYLVSELLEGKTLREEMNAGALPVRSR